MSFNNLLLALALTVLWPLVLMGVLAAAEWLERSTLAAREPAPREPAPKGLRPAASAPPEPVQAAMAGASQADAGTPGDAGAPASWAAGRGAGAGDLSEPADGDRVAARRAFGGGRHLRRAGGGRHERRG